MGWAGCGSGRHGKGELMSVEGKKKEVTGFTEAIKNNESLVVFMRKMKEFEQMFCDSMIGGNDFNIRLEIRGNQSEIIHCRVSTDNTERPKGGKRTDLD